MSKRLHIAYVCADRGVPIGGYKGASAHVAELTQALTRLDAEVRTVAVRAVEDAATSVIDLGKDRAARQMRQTVFAAARGPRQQAKAAEVYGLLVNQYLAHELDRLHRRWHIDAVYERYSLWSYAAANFARSERLPYLLEVNAPLREEQRRYRSLDNRAAAEGLESYLFRSADHVLVPSAELRPYVVGRGAAARRVHVMPNAADPEAFALPRVRRDDGTFVIGFLGTLKPWHGVEDLVTAFRRLHRVFPGYRLLFAGDGPLRPQLQRRLRQYGLDGAATFCGEVDHAGVPEKLAQMDIGVAPYPRLAGFYFSPLKIFEYMAAGLPVVASDIGQPGEILTHGKNALLHRPGAATELAARIEELRRDPALAQRLGRAGRAMVRRRFTWRRNAQRVLALIQRHQHPVGGANGSV